VKRRRFLRQSAAAAGAAVGASVGASAAAVATVAGDGLLWPRRLRALAGDLNSPVPADPDIWERVRAEFLMPADRTYLNVATLGPQPRVVVDAVIEHTRRVAMSYPPAIDWPALKGRVGRFLNGDPDGFAFPRNTTEAMSFIANGLDLATGDEVVTTLHEHIGGLCCWQLLAARRGVTLRQVELPAPAASANELLVAVTAALSDRTRVVSVSHVLFTNGTIMPVREIAAACRERGIICVVDGAHPPGMMRVDLADIGADFYASSPHKWLCAPQGSGLLWMSDAWRARLWPTLASGGWDDLSLGAHRFNHLGTADESRLAGLDAALGFHEAIGIDRIARRIAALRTHLIDGLETVPGLHLMSPRSDTLAAGMVSFRMDAVDALALQRRLAEANVRTRVISEYGYGWMRLSPHIYTGFDEIERVVGLIGD
jgi:isopenicillin-N epimerase